MNAQLRYALTDRLDVTEVAVFQAINARLNPPLRYAVMQRAKPSVKTSVVSTVYISKVVSH